MVVRGRTRARERSRALLCDIARRRDRRSWHACRTRQGRSLRDPVTLAIVVADAPELHGRLLTTLHAALPRVGVLDPCAFACDRSEEHTSELQSRRDLVCRLLLEKKKKK